MKILKLNAFAHPLNQISLQFGISCPPARKTNLINAPFARANKVLAFGLDLQAPDSVRTTQNRRQFIKYCNLNRKFKDQKNAEEWFLRGNFILIFRSAFIIYSTLTNSKCTQSFTSSKTYVYVHRC